MLAAAVLLRGPARHQSPQDIDWQWENNRRILLGRYLRKRLQVAQRDRLRFRREHVRGFGELLRGLQLALGVNDLRAPGALRLRLRRDRADHALVQVDVLDLDIGDLDAPWCRVLVENALDVRI